MSDLTREQIEALPAGPVLDRLVYEALQDTQPIVPIYSLHIGEAMLALELYRAHGRIIGYIHYSPQSDDMRNHSSHMVVLMYPHVIMESATFSLAAARAIALHAFDTRPLPAYGADETAVVTVAGADPVVK